MKRNTIPMHRRIIGNNLRALRRTFLAPFEVGMTLAVSPTYFSSCRFSSQPWHCKLEWLLRGNYKFRSLCCNFSIPSVRRSHSWQRNLTKSPSFTKRRYTRIYLPDPCCTIRRRRKEETELNGFRANETDSVKFANGLAELLARTARVYERMHFSRMLRLRQIRLLLWFRMSRQFSSKNSASGRKIYSVSSVYSLNLAM